jgi:WD40 repeat protein
MINRILQILLCTIAFNAGAQRVQLVVPSDHSQTPGYDFSPDGKYIISYSGSVILWEAATGNFIKELKDDPEVFQATFLKDSKHIAILCRKYVLIRDVAKGTVIQKIDGDFRSVVSNDHRDEIILQIGRIFSVYQKKGNTFQKTKTIPIKDDDYIENVHYSHDGNLLLYHDRLNKSFYAFDLIKNIATPISVPKRLESYELRSFTVSGKKLALGTADGLIFICDREKNSVLDSLVFKQSFWTAIDGKMLRDTVAVTHDISALRFMNADHLIAIYFESYRNVMLKAWDLSQRRVIIESSGDSFDFTHDRVACARSVYDTDNRSIALFAPQITPKLVNILGNTGKILFSNTDEREGYWLWDLVQGTRKKVALEYPGDIVYHRGKLATPRYYRDRFFMTEPDNTSSAREISFPRGEYDKIAFHPAAPHIALAGKDTVFVFDYESKKVVTQFGKPLKHITKRYMGYSFDTTTTREIFYDTIQTVAALYSPDGKYFCDDKNVYETGSYEPVDDISGLWDSRLRELGSHVNPNFFAADYTMLIRRNYTKHRQDTLYFGKRISRITLTPDQKMLAVQTTGDTLTFVETASLKIARKLDVGASLLDIDFTPDNRFMITSGDDAVIRIWDLQTFQQSATIIFYGDDWVATNSDYLFDGSNGGLAKLFFVDGLSTIELNQLKDRFYQPGLLEKILGYSNEPLRKSQGLLDIKPTPQIQLDDPNKNDKGLLNIRLKNMGGGIGKVKIWINRKEVMADARGLSFNADVSEAVVQYAVANHPYLRTDQPNLIEVRAYNKEEYLVSQPKKVYYIVGESKRSEPKLHALVIGTSDYNGQELDLRFAAKDAEQFAAALGAVGKKLFGEKNVNIKLLSTNDKLKWPSKANVENAFKDLSRSASPSDVLIIYLAGHGTNYGGTEGDFYYLTADAANGNISDPVIRKSVAISSDEFTEYIKWVPSLKQVMILDACHSGKFAEDLLAKREAKSSSEIRALERMKDRTGLYILSGSAADAVSYEASAYGQGLLTYSMLMGMKGAALRENEFVDVMRLFQYCADYVPMLAGNLGGIQKPEVRVPFGGESFDIGIVDESTKNGISLPQAKPILLRSAFQDEDTFADPIGLSEFIDQQLRSAETTGGQIIFIDALKFSGGYSLRGRYRKTANSYDINCKLLKGDDLVKDIRLTGKDKAIIAKLILEECFKVISLAAN